MRCFVLFGRRLSPPFTSAYPNAGETPQSFFAFPGAAAARHPEGSAEDGVRLVVYLGDVRLGAFRSDGVNTPATISAGAV